MNSQIYSNLDSVRNYNIFNQNRTNASNAMTRATTGLKVNSAKDSPAQWAISERMRERINSLNQASQNVQNDNALMKTAEGGVTSIIDVLNQIKANVLEAKDATTSDADRKTIANEIKSLFDQITYTATSTRYNGKYLLTPIGGKGGADGTTELKGIDNGAASTDGAINSMLKFHFQIGDDTNGVIKDVQFQNMTLKGLGLTNYTDALKAATGSDLTASGTLALLRVDSTGGSADNFIDALDEALTTAINAATDIGSYENRLGYTADNVATQIENLEASDSTIRSSDMAKEITEYMKWSVLSQASQYMLAQSNQNAFSALNLLQ